MSRSRLILLAVALVISSTLLGLSLGSMLLRGDVTKSIKKVEDAFALIANRYVEAVDHEEMAEDAIRGLLETLDPHSVYIDAERMRGENEQFNAAYEGIGVSYELISGPEGRDTVGVVSVIRGGPSEGVGLLTGDRLIAVNGESAVGFNDEDVQSNLKGPRGSDVTVTIRRPGVPEPFDVRIRRGSVPIETVDIAYMLDASTGFIKLNRFARTTHSEIRAALEKLSAEGAQRLILDLRGNGGGYMSMAVRVSDEFLADGQTIVSQKGRTDGTNETFRARGGGLWEDRPVMVLVDERSASASEIVAGALQDHDRGLIVGRRTFGKGLVQNQFVLDDGSALRVTIARYYTPTGRLIQTAYESGDRSAYLEEKRMRQEADRSLDLTDLLEELPDSLKYRTDGGRTVVAGGGILPDFIVAPDSLDAFQQAILRAGLERDFVRRYVDRHGNRIRADHGGDVLDFARDFRLDEAALQELFAMSAEKGLMVVSDAGQEDSDSTFLRTAIDEEGLRALIRGRIARRMFDRSGWYPAYRGADETLAAAQKAWTQAEALAAGYPVR